MPIEDLIDCYSFKVKSDEPHRELYADARGGGGGGARGGAGGGAGGGASVVQVEQQVELVQVETLDQQQVVMLEVLMQVVM